ncbi:unnamed protein product [Linum tenue]|uniref:Myb-like domain-containing protein n=1 Tax=Linum tenue TaxID=586396 RepID=A0AAV0HZQ6_9ROSI|nr:unnamed protein product [Linum tenue]
MGYKRLFDDTDFQELPSKQARQLDFSTRSTQFAENLPYMSSPKKPDSSVNQDNRNGKPLRHEASENAVVPKNCTDEDVSFKVAACSSLSPQYPDYRGLWEFIPFSNLYIPYFDRFPRKQVPLGQNHQAIIPPLCSNVEKHKKGAEGLSEPDALLMSSDDEKKLMGTCILPMPDTECFSPDQVGVSGSNCCCLDSGSLRCVQQHVSESRDKLKKSLGHENFSSLGFNNMGEEVAWKWTEDEERLFRAVIYSNPASSGQNFWNHLTQVFPARSMDEIVSYYFNVFMLRKRASQNRSEVLDVDSDDDELHGIDVGSYEGEEDSEEEEEGSGVESPVEDYSRQLNRGEDIVTEDDDDDDDDDDDGDGSSHMGNCCYGDFTGDENSGGVDYVSEGAPCGNKSFSGNMYDSVFKHAPEKHDDDQTAIQDDSCTSFEFQADKDDPFDNVYAKSCSSGGQLDACSYMMDVVPILDFHNDEVLYRLYSSPEKRPAEDVAGDYMVQDYSCMPSEPVGVAVEDGGTENGVVSGKVDSGCSDAMDLIPMLDFRDEKAWDAIFPGSV